MPIVFVFVLDGPQRPLEKRKKTVRTTPHWMTRPFVQLVETLGHHVHQAPGEAEAELATLNTVGAIDAVFTDDSDVFVFGARTVIRQPRNTKDLNLFEIYHSYLMEKKLTQNGILLVAVLQGRDYHKGLHGCGPTTSLELANTGLGTDLRFAADEDDATLHQLRWKSNFQRKLYEELAYNPNDLLSQKKVKLAESIPDNFPPMDVVRKYVFPVVSQSFYSAVTSSWKSLQLPDLDKLEKLCEQLFLWRTQSHGSQILVENHRPIWSKISHDGAVPLFNYVPSGSPALQQPCISNLTLAHGIRLSKVTNIKIKDGRTHLNVAFDISAIDNTALFIPKQWVPIFICKSIIPVVLEYRDRLSDSSAKAILLDTAIEDFPDQQNIKGEIGSGVSELQMSVNANPSLDVDGFEIVQFNVAVEIS
ncbi:hypothetical protein K435DRAFT_874379 [Dendrothele bispora CBS 962.96]|uniref:XPG-I domain-containing protein n=1 Tax=Dendrothele bispora (strain CBS 962.96) TaxID=1314807 RepID=A0A4V4HBS1_DENBC|nr:hypothetical protein K435DRAFT_874379 [Dendrothele bispora CBS 962.96]